MTDTTQTIKKPFKASGMRGVFTMHSFLKNIVWVWLLALIVVFGLLNGFFLTSANLYNILTQATVLGLLALAASLPLMVGEIDLSLAGNMGLSSAIGALSIIEVGLPTGAGVVLGIGCATFIGFFNGICITRFRMVSLIATLGMMIILGGMLLAITRGSTIVDLSNAYVWIGQAYIFGWPAMPVVLFVTFVAMSILLRRTVFGRQLYATGGNTAAAAVAGIQVNRIKVLAYTLAGFLAGIAGYLLAAWQFAITSDQGESFMLYSIAAPIIGGVSVFGGRGDVSGILGGVLLLTVISAGLSIVNVPSFYVEMIGGVLIFIAVAVDAIRVRTSSGGGTS